MNNENVKHRDIDRGYAWVILVVAFLCHGLAAGTSEIFGILYVEILDEYQVRKYLMYHPADGFLGTNRYVYLTFSQGGSARRNA